MDLGLGLGYEFGLQRIRNLAINNGESGNPLGISREPPSQVSGFFIDKKFRKKEH